MNVPIAVRDLLDAFEWVSSGRVAAVSCEAYVHRFTGQIYWCGNGIDEELPEDFKSLLDRGGQLQAWYEYEENAIHLALSEWCTANGFVLVLQPPARGT